MRRAPLTVNVRPHMSTSVPELLKRTERAFDFLRSAGFELKKRESLSPDSFKGGFVLTYSSRENEIVVQYLDMQLEVSQQGQELFGTTTHPEFSGNMFSRDHLLEYIDEIGEIVRKAIIGGGAHAV